MEAVDKVLREIPTLVAECADAVHGGDPKSYIYPSVTDTPSLWLQLTVRRRRRCALSSHAYEAIAYYRGHRI